MVDIRRTTAADAAALRIIRLAALQADPTAFGRTHDEVAEYGPELWIERASGSSGNATFFAVERGDVIGLVSGIELPEAEGRVELTSMWTDPRVRRRSVGRRLVEQVVQWAADRDTPEVRLWVTRGNDAAVRLYARCGFEPTDEVEFAVSDPCREEQRMVRRAHEVDTVSP